MQSLTASMAPAVRHAKGDGNGVTALHTKRIHATASA
jgi:hypothetical protein